MTIVRGQPSIGFSNRIEPPATLPPEADDTDQVIQSLIERLATVETLVDGKVDADRIRTQIAYSDEAVLIKAQDIVLAGDVTIAKVVNEQNGTTSGEVPESITRIIGDRIQTGVITSNNWGPEAGSAYDLNNGTITIGGSDNPVLVFDGGDLSIAGTLSAGSVIAGSVTIDGVQVSVIKGRAELGADLSDTLLEEGTAILKGVIQPDSTGAVRVGSITWSSSTGALTGGTGIAITEWGIIGASNGSATFSVNASNGNAVFSGALSAASGTFTGSLIAASGTFAGNLETEGQVYASGSTPNPFSGNASIVADPDDSSVIGVIGVGKSSGTIGVLGSNTSTGVAVQGGSAQGTALRGNTDTGIACALQGLSAGGEGLRIFGQLATAIDIRDGSILKSEVSSHRLRLYDSGGALVNEYRYEFTTT